MSGEDALQYFDVVEKKKKKKKGLKQVTSQCNGLAVSWVFCSYLYFVKASILA